MLSAGESKEPAPLAPTAAGTRVNGWQRLWVLTIGLWALVVAFFAWGLWPRAGTVSTAGSVSTGEVIARMDQEELAMLSTAALARTFGGRLLDEDGRVLPDVDIEMVDIGGHNVWFASDLSSSDRDHFAGRFSDALTNILDSKRRALAPRRRAVATQALAWWAIPALAVYALGWAVGWVRRGFHL